MIEADSVHSTPRLSASSIPRLQDGVAVQQRERQATLRKLAALRKEAMAEISRLIAFLDASDPYVMTEREEGEDDGPCDRVDRLPLLGLHIVAVISLAAADDGMMREGLRRIARNTHSARPGRGRPARIVRGPFWHLQLQPKSAHCLRQGVPVNRLVAFAPSGRKDVRAIIVQSLRKRLLDELLSGTEWGLGRFIRDAARSQRGAGPSRSISSSRRIPETCKGRCAVRKIRRTATGEAVIVTPVRPGGVNFPTIAESERAISTTAVFMAKPETVVMGDNKIHARGHSQLALNARTVRTFLGGGSVLVSRVLNDLVFPPHTSSEDILLIRFEVSRRRQLRSATPETFAMRCLRCCREHLPFYASKQ